MSKIETYLHVIIGMLGTFCFSYQLILCMVQKEEVAGVITILLTGLVLLCGGLTFTSIRHIINNDFED